MNDSPCSLLVDINGQVIGSQADAAGLTRVATDARITGKSGFAADVVADGTTRRLAVDARNARPIGSSLIDKYLLNGSASSMMVSGTAANPAKYSFSPASGTTATITGVCIVITAGTINFAGSTRFLNAAAMPNGLQIGVTVSGVTSVLATLKCNEDFLLFSTGNNFSAGTSGGLLNGGTNAVLVASLGFSQQLTPTDSVFIAVQDNLTAANTGNNLVSLLSSCSGFVNT